MQGHEAPTLLVLDGTQALPTATFGECLLEWGERPTVISRDVPAQVGAILLLAFSLDASVLVEYGHQVAPLVGNEYIEGELAEWAVPGKITSFSPRRACR